ncbi:MAG: biotin/lipoyl-containing protein [Peptococcia bacterium]|jgi:biotin carboxyl carrier protein
MKKFRMKVNGKVYEVEVEEISDNSAAAPQVAVEKVSEPGTGSKVPAVPSVSKSAAAIPEEAEVITAPMPGKILSLKVEVGQQVSAGDLLLILEAMKMENEIFCGTEGTVKEIRVDEGTAVNPGDVLVVIA